MGQHETQADEVVAAVLRGRPAPPPPEPQRPDYIADQLRPFREFMEDVRSKLVDARAHASVSEGTVRIPVHQMRDEAFYLMSNAGVFHTLTFRFLFNNPGFSPRLVVAGWDEQAEREFQALLIPSNGVVITYQFEAIIPVLKRYLTRFLTDEAALAGGEAP